MRVIVVHMRSSDVFSRGVVLARTGEEAGVRCANLIGVTVGWILGSIDVKFRRIVGQWSLRFTGSGGTSHESDA